MFEIAVLGLYSENVLKCAGKIINILKLYSSQLDIKLADKFEHTSDYLFPG